MFSLLSSCNTLPADRDKALEGRSDNWSAGAYIVDEGIMQIVIAPQKQFEYPESIVVSVKLGDEPIGSDTPRIRQGNSYLVEFPSTKAAYKHAEDLIVIVIFNGTEETIKLSLSDV